MCASSLRLSSVDNARFLRRKKERAASGRFDAMLARAEVESDVTNSSRGGIWDSRVKRVCLSVAIDMSASVIGVGGDPSLIIGSEREEGDGSYVRAALSRER